MQTTIRTLPGDKFQMKKPLTLTVKKRGRKFTSNLGPCGLIMSADGPSVRSVRDKLRRGLVLQCEILSWRARDTSFAAFRRSVKKKVGEFVKKVA